MTDTVPEDPRETGGDKYLAENAKKISGKMASIITIIEEKIPATDFSLHSSDQLRTQRNQNHDGSIFISTNTDLIGGYGENVNDDNDRQDDEDKKERRNIVLSKYTKENIYASSKINSPYVLFIGIHADIETLLQVKSLSEKDPNKSYLLGSHYYFDGEGNYDKIILLPPEVKDDRPALRTFDDGVRTVRCKIEPGEFEQVRAALNILEEGAKAL